jgi:hypothetical protein
MPFMPTHHHRHIEPPDHQATPKTPGGGGGPGAPLKLLFRSAPCFSGPAAPRWRALATMWKGCASTCGRLWKAVRGCERREARSGKSSDLVLIPGREVVWSPMGFLWSPCALVRLSRADPGTLTGCSAVRDSLSRERASGRAFPRGLRGASGCLARCLTTGPLEVSDKRAEIASFGALRSPHLGSDSRCLTILSPQYPRGFEVICGRFQVICLDRVR